MWNKDGQNKVHVSILEAHINVDYIASLRLIRFHMIQSVVVYLGVCSQ